MIVLVANILLEHDDVIGIASLYSFGATARNHWLPERPIRVLVVDHVDLLRVLAGV